MGMATYEIPCEECGQIMQANRRDRRFCSNSCASKVRYRRNLGRILRGRRENVACAYCGETFTPQRIDKRYCSRKCGRKAYATANREAIRMRQHAWTEKNPEKRKEILANFAAQHPDNGKERYARLRADPERWAAVQKRQREHYLANREEYLRRAKERQALQPTLQYQYRHGTDWGELFSLLWDSQEGRCYLCGDQLDMKGHRKIHLDHDHRCCPLGKSCEKCRRGLACSRCNTAIGHAGDDPERLHRIADNLAKAIVLVNERLRDVT